MIQFGNRSDFALHLLPLQGGPEDPDPAAAATWVALEIWIDGRNVTAHTHEDSREFHSALHWPAVYMARWLASAWPELYASSRWPVPTRTHPRNAFELLEEWDRRLAHGGEPDEELEARDAFLGTHCLAAAAAGGLAPALWFSRDVGGILIAWEDGSTAGTRGVSFSRPHGQALVSAEAFASAVHGFIDWVHDQLRSNTAYAAPLAEWLARFEQPQAAEDVLRRFAGLASERLDQLVRDVGGTLDEFFGLPAGWSARGTLADPEASAIAVAYRCVSPDLAIEDLQVLRDRIVSTPHNRKGFRALAGLALRAGPADSRGRDYEQGYRLAEAVRAALDNERDPLDVEALLSTLGVRVEETEISDESLDGAAVCDDGHGPTIIVNRRSLKAQTPWGRRMLLAHEFCHLLFARDAARPLALVSGPWAPAGLERRANAFAAELLLPRQGMLSVMASRRASPDDDDIRRFMKDFGVGLTTASWQADNRLGFGY